MKQETIDKIKKNRKGLGNTNGFKKGVPSFNKGQKAPWVSERNKINNPHKNGSESHLWKGGTSMRTLRKYAPRPIPEQCEICGAFGKDFKKGLNYEHNHNTGKFRGWVCTRCNTVMGMVKDNTETLFKIIKYLKDNE